MIRITTALIDQCATPLEQVGPREACSLAREFGPVGRWWLRPEILQRAAVHQPAFQRWALRPGLPNSLGSSWVVFAQTKHLPLLRPAFLLPLRWQVDTAYHPTLPRPLERLAKQVAQQFQACHSEKTSRWGLRLHEEAGLANVDLRPLDEESIDVASGWSALFGGLALAADECLPDPSVWATAAWNENFGIGPVSGLEHKLDLAMEWQAKQVYLPAENYRQALQALTGRDPSVELCPLLPVTKDPQPYRLLNQYLARCGAPPSLEAPFPQRRSHYCRVDRKAANAYHWSHLLSDVIQRCREQLKKHDPDCKPKCMVTVVSNSPSAVALAPAATAVKRCLLLYDNGDAEISQSTQEVERFLRRGGIDPLPAPVTVGRRDDEQGEIRQHLDRFSDGVEPSQIAFDLTPGYKSLSLSLAELAPRGSWLLYCRHKQLRPDNRIDPGTEVFDCWQRK